MRTKKHALLASLAVSILILAACGGPAKPSKEEPPAAPRPGPRTLPIPSREAAPEDPGLPAGPPPVGSAQGPPTGIVPPPPEGAGEGRLGLRWKVPTAWVEEPPSSSMRRAQYRVPGSAGDGECVVYYFGPNQGGDAMANAARWAGQFKQPDGSSSEQAMKTAKLEVPGIDVLVVDVTGTYSGGMTMTAAPAEEKPGYMLLGAIAAGPDANWFFKLTGPEGTLRAQRAAFEGMLRSLEVGR